ncbi:hypothetical protein EVAR_89605_1 [Eumeta japonica]|uniref:Uncharacterized protein n=1 Tax=Eumeta variegata TaxID=151549 RepID=A0A4C1XQW5_EUMVA|nr:hypothetical protein EVAR_89605_1 [Eumeta japonica]
MEKEIIDSLSKEAIVKETVIAKEDEGAEKTTPFQPLDLTSKHEVKTALNRFNGRASDPHGIKVDALKLGGEDMHDRIKGLKLLQYADDFCILNRATNPDHATMRGMGSKSDHELLHEMGAQVQYKENRVPHVL